MKQAVVITGIKAIDKKLKQLEPKVQKKVVRKAIRAGLKIIQAEAATQAPIDTGRMRGAIKVRALKKRKAHRISLEVRIPTSVEGLKVLSPYGGKPVFYPAIVEYGKHRQIPNPFMRRAFDSKKDAARDATMTALLEGLEQEIKSS